MMNDKVIEVYDAGFQDGRKERDYDPKSHSVVYDTQQRIEALTLALTEAHRVILHELDSGRTPYLLKAENGGKGFGYLEDTLSGITR